MPPSVLIVGAGVFGASTAYHLIDQHPDWKITVLDRTLIPPRPAASRDINKIIRADYSSALYAELAYEAIAEWKTWPSLKPFYHQSGWIMLDEKDSDLAERIRVVFRARGHDVTADVPLADLQQDNRWGGCLRGTDTAGFRDAYWNPEAGWCDASAATQAVMQEAIDKGVRYLVGDVDSLVVADDHVAGVRTRGDVVHTADKILLATGAWTSALLTGVEDQLDIAEADRVERQAQAAGVTVAHYEMSDRDMAALAHMPVVVYGGHGEVIPPPAESRLLKYTNAKTFTNTVTTASGARVSMPPDCDQHLVPAALQRETERLMTERVMPRFASAGNPPRTAAYWRICWDARTPSQDWLLARHPHPRLANLYLATGGSFHSYKFLPNVGRYAANVLTGKGNGPERDAAWGWKTAEFKGRGAHEYTAPTRELSELEADGAMNGVANHS